MATLDDAEGFPAMTVRVSKTDLRTLLATPTQEPTDQFADAGKMIPAPTVGREEVARRLRQLTVNPFSGNIEDEREDGYYVLTPFAIEAVTEALFSPTERADPGAGEGAIFQSGTFIAEPLPMPPYRYQDEGPVGSFSTTPSPASTSSGEGDLPADVVRLVIAARKIAFEDYDDTDIKELDAASEAFASRVPWEDEPEDGADSPSQAAIRVFREGYTKRLASTSSQQPAPGAPEGWREALEKARALFVEIKGDFYDPRAECREGIDIIDRALASSSAKPGGEEQ